VDDSKVVRMMIRRYLASLPIEIEEAEDGAEGLERLANGGTDVVLLDVTMPVMDGTTMLRTLRQQGSRTPVIMLTAESGTAVIGDALKLGIEDYILKPFKPEEVIKKVCKVLKLEEPASMSQENITDILCIDDIENVHKKLRSVLSEQVTMDSCNNAEEALELCRANTYKMVLVDSTLGETNPGVLLKQLKVLGQDTKFLLFSPRTDDIEIKATRMGFDGVLVKPFSGDALSKVMQMFVDAAHGQPMIVREDVVRFVGSMDARPERYFMRVKGLIPDVFMEVAAACYDIVYVDLTHVLPHPERIIRTVLEMERTARGHGMSMRLVGSPVVSQVIAQFQETASLPFFASVEEAREVD
jgi:two-component system chemotaxis response regulator CheY